MRQNIAPALAIFMLVTSAVSFSARPNDMSRMRPEHVRQVPVTTQKIPPSPISQKHPIRAQGAEGGMWRTDGGFSPTFMLKNLLDIAPMTVTPVLYMADGTEYDLPTVTLDAAGVAMINIGSALQEAPANIQGHISAYGSAGIRFQWVWPAVFAAIVNRDQAHSLVYQTHLDADSNFTHNPTAKQGAQLLKSTWWKEEPNVGGFLTLTNTSLSPIVAHLKVTDGGAQQAAAQDYSLASHATEWIDLSQLWGQLPGPASVGGIDISYMGPKHAIEASGGLEDEVNGYSQMLHFISPIQIESTAFNANSTAQSPTGSQAPTSGQPQTTSLDSTGVMTGKQEADMQFPQGTSFTPYLVLRNSTANAIAVQLTANMMGNAPVDLPLGSITLAPLESRQVDMKAMLKMAALDTYNGYINLRTTFNGTATDLLQESGSIDQTYNYVFEVPPRVEEQAGSRFLNYWNTSNDTDTMVTLWNYSNMAQDVILTFTHQEGKYEMPIHLEPHASTTMSIAKLIRSGAPDRNGNFIPTNIVQGSGKLSGVNGNSDLINVAMAVGVFNARTGTCTYQCTPCDYVEYITIDPAEFNVAVDSTYGLTVWGYYSDGSYDPLSAYWDSENTSDATVDSSGNVSGVAYGSTYIQAQYYSIGPGNDGGYSCDGEGCGFAEDYDTAPVAITPVITGGNTVWYFNGESPSGYAVSVTLSSSGGASGTWSVSAGGSKINLSTTSGTSTTVTSSGSAFSSSVNDVSVVLTVSGVASPAFHMTTRRPYLAVAGTINSNCDATWGYLTTLDYAIQDQLMAALPSAIGVNEYFTTGISNDYPGTNWIRGPATGITEPGSAFADTIGGQGSGYTPAPSCTLGPGTAVDHWGQEWRIGSTTPGVGQRIQTDTLQKYTNHAAHNAITTPAP